MTRIWVGRCASAVVVGIAVAFPGIALLVPAEAQKAEAPKTSGGTHAAVPSPPAAPTGEAHHAKPITSSAPPGNTGTAASPPAAAPPGPTAVSSPAAAVPGTPVPPSVPAPAAGATPSTAVPATPPVGEPTNNWGVGILGLALLAAGIFFGLRYARQRGLTMADALKRLGVEMPQDATAASAARLKPVTAPLPPLPSLADLPAAGPAPVTAAGVSVAARAAVTGTARLVGLEGPVTGEAFVLSSEPFTIGREVDNSLALTQDETVSRHHARVEQNAGVWMVTDAGSSNGTFVNGRRVAGSQSLQPGDVVQIGASRLRFEG